uniref:Uncharacterized protein n=1 Tax=Arundo donax TaxID=35708 RepID=A0A0A9BJK0_ARUDO
MGSQIFKHGNSESFIGVPNPPEMVALRARLAAQIGSVSG